jgi:uncharacterized membrane protein
MGLRLTVLVAMERELRPDLRPQRGRFTAASIVLGVGLGGLLDGIVVHQILQWHHLLSNPIPPDTVGNLELNTLADGVFHAAAWIVTLIGVLMLLASDGARRESGATRRFLGGFLLGWGLFNLVEGVVDHYLLNLHHVRPGPDQAMYDLAFLVAAAAMTTVGAVLVRRRVTDETQGVAD